MSEEEILRLKSCPESLRAFTSRAKFIREGAVYKASCPFHKENTPSFVVSLRDGAYLGKCFGCGIGPLNVFQFVQKTDKCSFTEAVKRVKQEIGTWHQNQDSVDKVFKPLSDTQKQYTTLTSEQWRVAEDGLMRSKDGREFLASRGIDYETAKRLRIGYLDTVNAMPGGWIGFPRIKNGLIVEVKYRSVKEKKFTRMKGTRTTELFNAETIDPLESLYVVEGEIDALTLEAAGYHAVSIPNATAAITPEMRAAITMADSVILAGDSDAVGKEVMIKLWNELQDRTYMLHWPTGMKDANETLMSYAKGSVPEFRKIVDTLTASALSQPMAGVFDLTQAMRTTNRVDMANYPGRLPWPWPNVNNMVNVVPGNVVCIYASQTGQGKTSFVMDLTIEAALKGHVILNYSAELSTDEYSNLVASYLLRKDRNTLTHEDYAKAADRLTGIRYYIGRNPDLDTAGPVLDLLESAIRKFGPTVVVLDHIHYICRNVDNEVQALANAMQRIKNIAGKYGVIFIVVGQPRKANQQNKGKSVHITDAKGSETFSSDADVVMALHRDLVKITDPANPPKEPYSPVVEVHLLKGRSMGKGNSFCLLRFVGEMAFFYEPSDMQPPQGELRSPDDVAA